MPPYKIAFLLASLACSLAGADYHGPPPKIELKRVPDSGIQPQVATASDGTIHLVYFKGDPAAGDLFYVRSEDGETFSSPIRVNSTPASAVALGNIRGARIAAGRWGQVYVVWNGAQKSAAGRPAMFFTRLNENHTAFEEQRNLIHSAYGLDGGGGIAADRSGRVYVFWHAPKPGTEGEESRNVWMARSLDDGQTFAAERNTFAESTGACGCCSLNAFADASGKIYVLFRSASEKVHRDMYLLVSKNHGATFNGSNISAWNVGYCVMSSEAFAGSSKKVFAAWETEKQVRFGAVESGASVKVQDGAVSTAGKNEKYPALAMNRSDDLLLAWTDGMGWKRGGALHWQEFDAAGKRIGAEGIEEGVPVWSTVANYSRRDGSFVILY